MPFVFQPGHNILNEEKFSCVRYCAPNAPIKSYTWRDINDLHISTVEFQQQYPREIYIPIGSVEYVLAFAKANDLRLPTESLTYYDDIFHLFNRKIKKKKFKYAKNSEFVKPTTHKSFTGDIKKNLINKIDPNEIVWASEPVPFESEFRFYIHVTLEPEIVGWSRYDNLEVINPPPDINLVDKIIKIIHNNIGPNAYAVDIGWRPDLGKYDIVELNDAWSLGFYNNNDIQSSPPSPKDYVEMLVSRWTQILFANKV